MECNLLNEPRLKLHFFVVFFCEKQENLLDFFRRCFLALVFFSSNFFVKGSLIDRNWKKKKNCCMIWLLLLFFCFLSSKASVRHSKVSFSFLKEQVTLFGLFFCFYFVFSSKLRCDLKIRNVSSVSFLSQLGWCNDELLGDQQQRAQQDNLERLLILLFFW